ncbi:MAG TPA: hypothetical protein PKX55_04815, partial [Leptospiraceae bacterium]|nr:hypothetical protein [Leptospiraceae bacterium]
NALPEEELPLKTPDQKIYSKKEGAKKEESFFSIKAFKKTQEEIHKSIWGNSFSKPNHDELLTTFGHDNQIRPNPSQQTDIYTYYKDEKVSLNSIGDSRSVTNQILEYRYQNKITETNTLLQNRNTQIRNVEMSYQINSNFSANFKSTQFDIFDDRLKQYPTTMAGISFTSKYVSTGFIAGESSFNNPYRYNQVGFLNGNNYYRDTEIQLRDTDRANRNLFEWQANISPTKNLMFQTAVYNSNRSLINETNVSEGVRIAMAIGLKYIVLNFKYNYLSDNLMRSLMRPDSPSFFNKDYAAFGLTFFIDKNKKYSIYIGNNVYNIATMTKPTDSSSTVPVNNSFSASFRGRNSDFNTTFFFNFKNNANREFYYSNFGVFRLPISSQVNFDYATSMGLELSF